jgi:TctA family transporter
MHIRIINRRDFLAGIFFSGLGAIVGAGSLQYSLGTVMRMGPGYFPLLLAGVLVALGIFVVSHALSLDREQAPAVEAFALRPIALVAAGVLLFAFSVQSLGLVIATIGLVTVSGVAYQGFRWGELAVLGVTLSAFAVGVFSYGLSLPFQALPI